MNAYNQSNKMSKELPGIGGNRSGSNNRNHDDKMDRNDSNYPYKKRNASGQRGMVPLNNSIELADNNGVYNMNSTPGKVTASKQGIIQNGLNSLHGINQMSVGASLNNSKTPKEQFKRMQIANSNNQGHHSNRVQVGQN